LAYLSVSIHLFIVILPIQIFYFDSYSFAIRIFVIIFGIN